VSFTRKGCVHGKGVIHSLEEHTTWQRRGELSAGGRPVKKGKMKQDGVVSNPR